MSPTDFPTTPPSSAKYSKRHDGIAQRLRKLDEMPELVAAIARARTVAQRSLQAARDAILSHHLEEERELFTSVLAASETGAERMHVQAVIERLTAQHRQIESLWAAVEGELVRGVTGCANHVELDGLQQLTAEYEAHARFEESVFLPMAESILERDGHGHASAALGLARHAHALPEFPFQHAA